MVQLMTVLTLGVALWEYRNADGRKHRAYYGQQLDVTDAELERGERANVFAAQTEERGIHQADTPDDSPDSEPPVRVRTKPVLVEWLVEHRNANRGAMAKLTKGELWQHMEPTEHVAAKHYPTDLAT
jgi:hypothetical protein